MHDSTGPQAEASLSGGRRSAARTHSEEEPRYADRELILAGALAAQAPAKTPDADDYVGRWNVKITDAEDTFVSGGFQITRKDGALSGGARLALGQLPAGEVGRGRRTGARGWCARRSPGSSTSSRRASRASTLKGQVTYPDGKVHHFEGKRAPLLLSKKAPAWGAPVTLFDGKTLAGWKLRDTKKKNGWAVVNGELAVVEPKDNADLVSEQTFQDMKLHIEFNVDPKSNSGVYLRGRYEIQILDNPDQKMALDTHGCGAIYSRIAPKRGRHEARRRVADLRHRRSWAAR